MRELGFRAFIKPLGRYATGLDTIQFHKCCDVAGAGIWTVVTVNEGIFEGDDIIVEQDTGLNDRNGEKIHEGDIVRCSFGESGVVKLRHGAYCVVGDDITDMSNWKESAYEIIGNIHENPELLEAKNVD